MRTAVIATLAVFVATLAVASAYSLTLEHESMLFNAFVREHRKVYKTASEQLHRFGVFRENLRYITEFNKGNHDYELAMNHFGDLTFEEFRDTYLSRKDSPRYSDLLSSSRLGVHDTEADPVTAPTSIDWRAKGKVTRVKNQGSCGSCWAFSAVGAVEGAHAIKTGSLIELSEQNLVSCSKNGGNAGCNGGLMQSAFDYIVKNGGIDTEACYPYTAKDSACAYKATCKGAYISGHVDVRSGCESCLVDAVALGPVSVSISASSSAFQFYSKGVFASSTCPNRMNDLDHGVLAVGYGEENGVPYWIVKNSWGVSWGEGGYIRMKRGVNQCGIALDSSYPKI